LVNLTVKLGMNITKNKKRVLILGASSDIGCAVSKIFLENDWELTAHYYNNKESLLKIDNYINKINFLKLDLRKANFIEKYLKINKSKFMKFDAFVNLSGYFKHTKFSNFKIKEFYDHINANSLSSYLFIRTVLSGMKKRKWGRVVNTSSIGTKFGGGKESFCYSLSKFNNEFFPSHYRDLYSKNILINTLQIGLANTKMQKKLPNKNMAKRIKLIPLKRITEKDEIAQYIYNLCIAQNSLLTGQIINISGGE
jgi:3-oxoacyl-[acyl-carrier protein] reductase